MSIKTYLEAIEYALDSEMEARGSLIVLRPGARPAFDENERDVAIPRMGKSAFSVATGAAMCGMHPVLDLRLEKNAAEILEEALDGLSVENLPEITVIVNADEKKLMECLAGVRFFAPETPRQAAGFTRAALRSAGVSLLIADQTLYGEEDDVPEESDFVLLPLDGETEEAECAGNCTDEEETACADDRLTDVCGAIEDPDEAEEYCPDEKAPSQNEEAERSDGAENGEEEALSMAGCQEEEDKEGCGAEDAAGTAADEEKDAENREKNGLDERTPEISVMPSMRALPCSLKRLRETAEELEAPMAVLIDMCMKRLEERGEDFEWVFDEEALSGECAYLPAKNAACVWLGCDMLTVCYDADKISHQSAAALLRAVKRLVEKPTLLIYDKESMKS